MGTSLRCTYSINEVGDYKLEVYINGRLIDSGPLNVAGYDLSKVRVHPVKVSGVGVPAQFTGKIPINSIVEMFFDVIN